jgi:phosphoglycolate phosphatase
MSGATKLGNGRRGDGRLHWGVRLIVFDLDGTLVDSRADLAASVNQMLGEYRAAALAESDVTGMVGEGARMLVSRALAAAGLPSGHTPHALRRFLDIYDSHLLDHTRPYRGIPEALERLSADATLAVLTNKPTAASVRILEGLGLHRYFKDVLGGDSLYPRKPDPASLMHLMNEHGAAREETLMVGDSAIDLQTADNAGVPCCLVSWGFGFIVDTGKIGDRVFVANTPAEIAADGYPPRANA